MMYIMADIGNNLGRSIYPGIEYLAAMMRMSERQTKRIIEELVRDEWIVLAHPGTPGRKIDKERYFLNLEKVSKCPPLFTTRGTLRPQRGTFPVKKGDTISKESPAGSQSSPQPLEPIYNHATKDRIDNLRQWIKQLKTFQIKNPDDEHTKAELERVSEELVGIEESLNPVGAAGAG